MNCNKVLSLIGLSTKAGKIVSGVFNGESSKDRKGLAGHRFGGKRRTIPKRNSIICVRIMKYPVMISEEEELGGAMGKEFRASLAVTDENLAAAMEKQLKSE